MNLETLELFYNQTEICKALHQEKFDQLQQLIREKDLQLHDLYGRSLLYQRLFLSSLNKSLYYYYLNVFGLSFSQVYQNFSQAHPSTPTAIWFVLPAKSAMPIIVPTFLPYASIRMF